MRRTPASASTATLNVRFATAAARAGKHLLIEKPLAPTVADCRRIADEVERAGVIAMVGHTLRFSGVVAALRAFDKKERLAASNLPSTDSN